MAQNISLKNGGINVAIDNSNISVSVSPRGDKGPLGPKGPEGPQGPQGPSGDAGHGASLQLLLGYTPLLLSDKSNAQAIFDSALSQTDVVDYEASYADITITTSGGDDALRAFTVFSTQAITIGVVDVLLHEGNFNADEETGDAVLVEVNGKLYYLYQTIANTSISDSVVHKYRINYVSGGSAGITTDDLADIHTDIAANTVRHEITIGNPQVLSSTITHPAYTNTRQVTLTTEGVNDAKVLFDIIQSGAAIAPAGGTKDNARVIGNVVRDGKTLILSLNGTITLDAGSAIDFYEQTDNRRVNELVGGDFLEGSVTFAGPQDLAALKASTKVTTDAQGKAILANTALAHSISIRHNIVLGDSFLLGREWQHPAITNSNLIIFTFSEPLAATNSVGTLSSAAIGPVAGEKENARLVTSAEVSADGHDVVVYLNGPLTIPASTSTSSGLKFWASTHSGEVDTLFGGTYDPETLSVTFASPEDIASVVADQNLAVELLRDTLIETNRAIALQSNDIVTLKLTDANQLDRNGSNYFGTVNEQAVFRDSWGFLGATTALIDAQALLTTTEIDTGDQGVTQLLEDGLKRVSEDEIMSRIIYIDDGLDPSLATLIELQGSFSIRAAVATRTIRLTYAGTEAQRVVMIAADRALLQGLRAVKGDQGGISLIDSLGGNKSVLRINLREPISFTGGPNNPGAPATSLLFYDVSYITDGHSIRQLQGGDFDFTTGIYTGVSPSELAGKMNLDFSNAPATIDAAVRLHLQGILGFTPSGDVSDYDDTGLRLLIDGSLKKDLSNIVASDAQLGLFRSRLDLYSKDETDMLLDNKMDSGASYTKGESDDISVSKADKANTYTQTIVDGLLDLKANIADLPDPVDITGKANTTLLNVTREDWFGVADTGRRAWGLESSRERQLARDIKANKDGTNIEDGAITSVMIADGVIPDELTHSVPTDIDVVVSTAYTVQSFGTDRARVDVDNVDPEFEFTREDTAAFVNQYVEANYADTESTYHLIIQSRNGSSQRDFTFFDLSPPIDQSINLVTSYRVVKAGTDPITAIRGGDLGGTTIELASRSLSNVTFNTDELDSFNDKTGLTAEIENLDMRAAMLEADSIGLPRGAFDPFGFDYTDVAPHNFLEGATWRTDGVTGMTLRLRRLSFAPNAVTIIFTTLMADLTRFVGFDDTGVLIMESIVSRRSSTVDITFTRDVVLGVNNADRTNVDGGVYTGGNFRLYDTMDLPGVGFPVVTIVAPDSTYDADSKTLTLPAPVDITGLATTATTYTRDAADALLDLKASTADLPAALEGGRGADGARGPTGPQGPIGTMGPVGFMGDQGSRGIIGPDGPIGSMGDKGETGDRGTEGPQGQQGIRGEQGMSVDGDPGAQGPAGNMGPEGLRGPVGDMGGMGTKGVDGDRGADGEAGLRGPTGPPGDPGLLTGKLDTDFGNIATLTPEQLSGVQTDLGIPSGVGSILHSPVVGTASVSILRNRYTDLGVSIPTGVDVVFIEINTFNGGNYAGLVPVASIPAGGRGAIGYAIAGVLNSKIYIRKSSTGTLSISADVSTGFTGAQATVWSVSAPQGPKGDPGGPGDKGEMGDVGLQGAQGLQGPVGEMGPIGDKGVLGDKGDLGDQGDKGLSGDKGLTGDIGSKGPVGDRGDKGLTGDMGPIGSMGPTGEAGDVGRNSIQTNNIVDGAITSRKLANGSVENVDIADGTIEAGKLAPGVIPDAYDDTTLEAKVDANTSDISLLATRAGTYSRSQVSQVIASSTYTRDAVDALVDVKLNISDAYDDAPLIAKVDLKANIADTYNRTFVDQQVNSLSDQITRKADTGVSYTKAEDDSLLAGKIDASDGAVTGTNIASGTIDNSNIKNQTITGRKIKDGAVDTMELADGAVTRGKLSFTIPDEYNDTALTAKVDANTVLANTKADASALALKADTDLGNLVDNLSDAQKAALKVKLGIVDGAPPGWSYDNTTLNGITAPTAQVQLIANTLYNVVWVGGASDALGHVAFPQNPNVGDAVGFQGSGHLAVSSLGITRVLVNGIPTGLLQFVTPTGSVESSIIEWKGGTVGWIVINNL